MGGVTALRDEHKWGRNLGMVEKGEEEQAEERRRETENKKKLRDGCLPVRGTTGPEGKSQGRGHRDCIRSKQGFQKGAG